MKQAITRLLTSTKFLTTVIGMIVTAGATLFTRYGIDVSTEALQQVAITVASLFGILLHAQGRADQGKEAAKVVAATPAVPQTVQINDATIEVPSGPTMPLVIDPVTMPGLPPR